MTAEPSLDVLLGVLRRANVDFVLIGGLAAVAYGSARATFDIDVVYARNDDNVERLVEALSPYNPYLRGAPVGLPFVFDVQTVQRGLNFTLTTSLGDLDLLGEVVGGGFYEDLIVEATTINLFGFECPCVTLEQLIRLKRAAGRPRDLDAVAELEALLEEKQRRR